MATLFEKLTDFRDRILRSLKLWLLDIRSGTWQRLRPVVLQVVVWLVSIYRLKQRKVVFIGITGSCGKTTTKEMVAAVLSSQYKGHKSRGNNNVLGEVVRSILLTRTGYKFCVQEFNVGGIGEAIPLEKQFQMFKPQVGVVTTIGDDHISAHGSREAIAAEKGKLIEALPKNGTAVLNADDHLVLAMQSRCKGRIFTYGFSPDAMLRAEDIHDDWPDRLSLTVLHDGQSVRVQTQFCGAHLVPSVLAAMAVGRAMDVSLQSAAAAFEHLSPVPGRMYPIDSPDGISFIRDDVKAPVWAIPSALDFMRRATAKRKIIVLGNLSDYQKSLDPTYAQVAREALGVSDFVFFVGRWASRCLRAKRHPEDQAVKAFVSVDHLNGFLSSFLEPGDLVLLKGSGTDHLERIVSAWIHKPKGLPSAVQANLDSSVAPEIATGAPIISTASTITKESVSQLVVGLGNPGQRFQHTPHNVGQRTLDLLIESLQLNWSDEEWGMVALIKIQDQQVLLVKPATYMNLTGPWMRQIADQLKLTPHDCVIIHDDINLKPGVVRNRMSGSSGGHRGIESIIAAFQSENMRRVKIGVGQPPNGKTVTRYVLTPFKPAERDTIEKSCSQAANRVLEMIKAFHRI